VMELRHQCKVIISLAAVHQCFSLEVEFSALEVLKKPVPYRGAMRPVPAFSY
jgi:hypothetical protein